MILPSSLAFPLLAGGTHVGLSAAVERGPSQGARSGSTGPTWVSPAYPSHRARSASKKDSLAVPHIPFLQAQSLSISRKGGLLGLPLRASNEGSPRPRVARAQEINRLPFPLL